VGAAWFLAALLTVGAARAQDDPPGRVGRIADLQGQVWAYDIEAGQWIEAERNRPLTQGDRVSTAPDARAELRVGSTVIRLGGVTELEVLRLDDERIGLQLHAGSLALRVQSREVANEIELVTAEARLRPLRAGHYRLDRTDDTSHAGTWRGSLRVADVDGLVVDTGQRIELWREGDGRRLSHAWTPLPDDAFARWVASADLRDQRSAATQYVSPEMTGAEDLDRHGRWDRNPEYGAVWFPYEVRSGWAPYRYGRWVWMRPWGWTWIDEAPWGFAPFHYGRWVHWGGRWGWWPGAYVARPVFAPALVAWVGGSNWGVSVNVGGPAIGWVPLAPREVFVPWYRATPIYVDRVNRHPRPPPGRKPVPQVPTGPIMYGNQGVPGAVTVVPRDVLVRRQPVSRAVIEPRAVGAPERPLERAVPPPMPAPMPRADGNGQGPAPRTALPQQREHPESAAPRPPRETPSSGAARPGDQPAATRPPMFGVPPGQREAPPPGRREPAERTRQAPAAPTSPSRAAPDAVAPTAPAVTRPAPPFGSRPAAPAATPAPAAPPRAPVAPVAPAPAAAPAPAPVALPAPAMPAAPPAVTPPPARPAPERPPRTESDERKQAPEFRNNTRQSER